MIDNITEKPIDLSTVVVHPNNLPPEAHRLPGKQPPEWLGKLLKWIIPVAALLFLVLGAIPALLQKWLWMREMNYGGIFWTLFSVKWGMTCTAFVGAFLFLWVNLRLAFRNSLAVGENDSAKNTGSGKKARVIEVRGVSIPHHLWARSMAIMTAFVAGLFAVGFYTQWDTYLRFHYGGSFGLSEPVFGVDLGFYLFRLPFYQLLQSNLVFLTGLTIVAVGCQYAYLGLLRFSATRRIETRGPAVQHAAILFGILAATFGWGETRGDSD